MSILEQIIQEMYIDPELLEQMGEEHKQILFRKIREEQVRRWKIKDAEDQKVNQKPQKKKVDFLLGANNEPWVWVMGDHVDDLPYELLVNRRETLKQEDENYTDYVEAKKLAKKGIMALMDTAGTDEIDGSLHHGLASITESPEPGIIRTESQIDTSVNKQDDIQRQLDANKIRVRKLSIIGTTPEEREKFEEERVAEVLGTLRRTKSIAKKRSEEMEKKLEDGWRESQVKANIYERSRRYSFKKAREMTVRTPNIHETILEDIPSETKKEIVRRMSVKSKPIRPAPAPPRKKLLKMTSFVEKDSTPKTPAHVVNWFKTTEAPKGVGKERDGSISVWFHGKIGREVSMKVLQNEPTGSYLVRLSAKLWGYTVSVKTAYQGCRHFLVDGSSGQYNFLGPKQRVFRTLTELLQYYKTNPITWDGKEFLMLPVGIEDERNVYGGLYSDDDDDDEDSSIL